MLSLSISRRLGRTARMAGLLSVAVLPLFSCVRRHYQEGSAKAHGVSTWQQDGFRWVNSGETRAPIFHYTRQRDALRDVASYTQGIADLSANNARGLNADGMGDGLYVAADPATTKDVFGNILVAGCMYPNQNIVDVRSGESRRAVLSMYLALLYKYDCKWYPQFGVAMVIRDKNMVDVDSLVAIDMSPGGDNSHIRNMSDDAKGKLCDASRSLVQILAALNYDGAKLGEIIGATGAAAVADIPAEELARLRSAPMQGNFSDPAVRTLYPQFVSNLAGTNFARFAEGN